MNSFQNVRENGEINGNGSSINNSASDVSDDESSSLKMTNQKTLMEIMTQAQAKPNQEIMSRMMNSFDKELLMKFQEKIFSMHQSNLLGNLLGINDQDMMNKMFTSTADEAAKMLGVEK